jgi:Acyl-coenzyme A:6-aminopenicillanic acid acyl-transferase
MVPWLQRPAIDVDMSKPSRLRYAHVPRDIFASGRRLLDAVMTEVPSNVRYAADWVRLRTLNRFQSEAEELARQVGAGWRDVIIANISYDLVLSQFGCSTAALPTPTGPVVARNMDWWPEAILAQTSCLIRYFRGNKFQFANAGWPGAIGVVTGLSARGFAVVLNAVTCTEGIRKTGYPVLLHLRRVLQDARDFDHALHMLSRQTLTASALFTLVGTDNRQRVVIERTPTRHAQRWPQGDEPLLATNDYRLLDESQAGKANILYQTACGRYDALCRYFAGHSPNQRVDDAHLLYVLSDDSVMQGITAQHIVMRPRTGEIQLFVPRRLLEDPSLTGRPALVSN